MNIDKSIIPIILLILSSLLVSSCENREETDTATRILLISEPLENRADKWDENSLHDENCLGFYKTHFNPTSINAYHFKDKNFKELENKTNIKWNRYTTTDELIDFNKYFTTDTAKGEETVIMNKVVYVSEIIYTVEKGTKFLSIGSDDGFALWVNGDSITNVHKGKNVVENDDIIPILLKKGTNIISYKIGQGGGGWKLFSKILSIEDVRSVLLTEAKETMYFDLLDASIIEDDINYITLKKNSKIILDSLNTIEFTWMNLFKTFTKKNIPAYKLPDTLFFPKIFDGFLLLRIKVKDQHNRSISQDLYPIFTNRKSEILANKLADKYNKIDDPHLQAKIKAVNRMFRSKKMVAESGWPFSTRIKAFALFDLYSYVSIGKKAHMLYMGPKTLGYFLMENDSLQSFKLFIPPNLYSYDGKQKKIKATFFINYLIKDTYDFWDSRIMSSHKHNIKRNNLASRHNTIIVAPYGGGINNFTGVFEEEIPLIFNYLKENFPIDTANVSLITFSDGANIAYEILQRIELPLKYLGHISLAVSIDRTNLELLFAKFRGKYRGLKLFVRHGLEDTVVPVERTRKIIEVMKKYFEVNYKEMKYSEHINYFRNPDMEFLELVNSK